MTTKLDKVLYTAKTHTIGGRDGNAKSDDGNLEVKLTPPKSMGGSGGATNPEQLFAAGYSACFLGALRFVGGQKKVSIPQDATIDAEVDLGPTSHGFGISVRLRVHIPGVETGTAQELVTAAHQVCPYSNATRGNIDVELSVV